MPRVIFSVEARLPPDHVVGMLIDFSERRPDIWPMLDRRYYKVVELRETTAIVEEGGPPELGLWERLVYDWGKPGRVRWFITQSNAFTQGSYVEVNVSAATNGGSHVRVEWARTPKNLRGFLLTAAVVLTHGGVLRKKVYEAAFNRA